MGLSKNQKVHTGCQRMEAIECIHNAQIDHKAIGRENMLFTASGEFALENGGEITKNWIEAACDSAQLDPSDMIIDTRYHDLPPGYYPAIPGWHVDDVPRGKDRQPNFDDPAYRAEHILTLIGDEDGAASRTRFAVGEINLPAIEPGKVVYDELNQVVEKALTRGDLEHTTVAQKVLYHFKSFADFHEAQHAYPNADNKRGWSRRWFGRASYNTGRVENPLDIIRTTVNTYFRRAPILDRKSVEMNGMVAPAERLEGNLAGTTQELMKETMVLEMPIPQAKELAGGVTKRLIDSLPVDWKNEDTVITTGVYMLMQGWDVVLPTDLGFSVHSKLPILSNEEYLMCTLGGAADISYMNVNFEGEDGKLLSSYAGFDEGMINKTAGWDCPNRALESGKIYKLNGDGHIVSDKAKKSGWQYVALVRKKPNTESIAAKTHHQVNIHLRELFKGW